MVVEKRGGLKNKMIVGGLLVDPRKHSDYLYMASPDHWEIVYYVLDLNTGEVSSLPHTVVDYACSPSIAAVGSRLYLFASGKSVSSGDDSTKRKKNNKKGKRMNQQQQSLFSSHMLDLTKPENGWRLATSGVDRLWPMGVIEFGGKIYVFDNSELDGFICEVFDPQNNKWRRLKSPPFPPATGSGDGDQDEDYPTLTLPVMADLKNNRIIIYFENISTMYAYYPCEDRWRCVVEDFNGWFSGGQPVTLANDGVIYIYSRMAKAFFRAYDTFTKEWLNVRLSPEAEAKGDYQSYHYYSTHRTLLHRGNGLLCLLTFVIPFCEIDEVDKTPAVVHLVQFKVELVKLNDYSKEVLVTPLSSQFYHLHSRCSTFLYLPV